MQASCQCGAVRFTPPPPLLDTFVCHCTECRAQAGSAFGVSALFALPAPGPGAAGTRVFPLHVFGDAAPVGVWVRETASGTRMHCCFCTVCGVRLLHAREGVGSVSVKGGCVSGLDWDAVWHGKHIWVKSAVVPIPAGVQAWAEEPDE